MRRGTPIRGRCQPRQRWAIRISFSEEALALARGPSQEVRKRLPSSLRAGAATAEPEVFYDACEEEEEEGPRPQEEAEQSVSE